MRALVQRVIRGEVRINDKVAGKISTGLVILLGVAPDDDLAKADYLADRCARLRIFEDDKGKMNFSLKDTGGEALVISQFTLYADTAGRRPSFSGAARPEVAIPCYERFISALSNMGIHVETGTFGADMKVELVNDGPVTIMLESKS